MFGNHDILTKMTLICKANVNKLWLQWAEQRVREKTDSFLQWWRWKASHVLFCFSPAGEKERLNWSVICWQPCYLFHGNSGPPTPFSLSLFFSLYLQPYPSPPFIHIDLLYLSLFLSLHLVQDTDDKVSHLTFLEFLHFCVVVFGMLRLHMKHWFGEIGDAQGSGER